MKRDFWGWLVFGCVAVILIFFGHIYFSFRNHNWFVIVLLLISMAITVFFVHLYSNDSD
jgi:cell division protein FtsW (lipid II flippase)